MRHKYSGIYVCIRCCFPLLWLYSKPGFGRGTQNFLTILIILHWLCAISDGGIFSPTSRSHLHFNVCSVRADAFPFWAIFGTLAILASLQENTEYEHFTKIKMSMEGNVHSLLRLQNVRIGRLQRQKVLILGRPSYQHTTCSRIQRRRHSHRWAPSRTAILSVTVAGAALLVTRPIQSPIEIMQHRRLPYARSVPHPEATIQP